MVQILKKLFILALLTGCMSAQVLQRPNGGTGLSVAGTVGNVLTSDGTNWISSAPAGGVTGSGTTGNPAVWASSSSLGNATAHNQFLPLDCADTSGSGTAQVCNTTPTFTPAAKDCILYTTTTDNSGTGLTFNVNSLGAKSVAKWQSTTTLAAHDVRAGAPILACYDGTNWEVTTIGNAPSGGGGGSPYFSFDPGSVTIPSTAFTQPSPACGTIIVHSTSTLNMPTTNPAAGTCIEVHTNSPNSATFTVSGAGQSFSNNYVGGTSTYWNSITRIVSDGVNTFYVNSVQGPANDLGNNDLFYGWAINGQFNGYNTMFCTDCGNASLNIENTIMGRTNMKNANGAQQDVSVGFNTGGNCTSCQQGVAIGISTDMGSNGFGNTTVGSGNGGTERGGGENGLFGGASKCDVPSGSYSDYVCLNDLLYGDWNKGFPVWKSPAASVTSCGSSPALSAGSGNARGEVTPGTGSPTACTLTFSTAWNQAPYCQITPLGASALYISAKSTSSFTVSAVLGTAVVEFDYECAGATNSSTPTP